MTVERAVLDANVVISAALRPHGRPRAVLDAMRTAHASLLFSDETFDELRTRLHSDHLLRTWRDRLDSVCASCYFQAHAFAHSLGR